MNSFDLRRIGRLGRFKRGLVYSPDSGLTFSDGLQSPQEVGQEIQPIQPVPGLVSSATPPSNSIPVVWSPEQGISIPVEDGPSSSILSVVSALASTFNVPVSPSSLTSSGTASSSQSTQSLDTFTSSNTIASYTAQTTSTISAISALKETSLVVPPTTSSTSQIIQSSLSQVQLPQVQTNSSIMSTSSSAPMKSASSSPSVSLTTITSNPSDAPLAPSSSSVGGQTNVTSTANSLSTSPNTHGTEFYIGIVFGSIAAAACALALLAYILRLRRRKRGFLCCGSGGDDDDPSVNDLGFGLGSYGAYLDAPATQGTQPGGSSSDFLNPSKHMDPNNVCTPFRVPFGNVNTDDVYPKPETMPRMKRDNHTMSPATTGRKLGPLQLANFLPGDIQSSSDESSRPVSRYPSETSLPSPFATVRGTLRKAQASTSCVGTLREKVPGSTPRFLALKGPGLDLPWALKNNDQRMKSEQEDGETASAYSGIERGWKNIPLSPQGASDYRLNNPAAAETNTDSWGASLRTSLMSAISAVTGRASGSENAADMADRPSTGSFRKRWMEEKNGSRSSAMKLSRSTESDVEEGHSFATVTRELSGLGFKYEPSRSPISGLPGMDYRPTSPLVVHKKPTQRKKYRLSDPGFGLPPSRTESEYSQRSASVSIGDKSKAVPAKGISNVNTSLRNSNPTGRPTFFKRATSSGWSSASSSGSMDSSVALAKRVMMMRERRKKSLEMGWSESDGHGRVLR